MQIDVEGGVVAVTNVVVTLDLCSVLSASGVNCPIPNGDHTVKVTYTLPTDLPAGVTIKVERTIKNPDGSLLLCCTAKIKANRG